MASKKMGKDEKVTDETLRWQQKMKELEKEFLRKDEMLKHTRNEQKMHAEELSQRLHAAMYENKQLQMELHDTTMKLEKVQETMYHHQSVVKEHQSQIISHTKEIKAMKQEKVQLKQQVQDLGNDLQQQMFSTAKYQSDLKSQKMKSKENYKEMKTKYINAAQKLNSIIDGQRKECQQLSTNYQEALDRIRELETWVMEITQLHAQIDQLSKDVSSQSDQLHTKEKEIRILQEENARLSESLSKECSTKGNKENISMINRPMMLKSEYENICPNEWLAAKTELDKLGQMDEKDQKILLCDILMKAQEYAKKHYHGMMTSLKQYLTQPLTCRVVSVAEQIECENTDEYQSPKSLDDSDNHSHTSEVSTPSSSLPVELQNAVADYMRISAKTTNVSNIVQHLSKQLATKEENKIQIADVLRKESLQEYMSVCSSLAWKMVTQRPQMEFIMAGTGDPFDEKIQEASYGSDDPFNKNAPVAYYVTPALYHAKNLMVKGRVWIEIAK